MKKLTTEEILIRFRNQHGQRYDYTYIDYKSVDKPIEIICKEHGVFLQSPYNHFNGSGCIKCAYSSYTGSWNFSIWEKSGKKSKYFDGYKLYLIAFQNEYERFFKIGRTFLPIKTRLSKNIPYFYHVLIELKFKDAYECCEIEKELHNDLKSFKYIPKNKFNGYNECYEIKNLEENMEFFIDLYDKYILKYFHKIGVENSR